MEKLLDMDVSADARRHAEHFAVDDSVYVRYLKGYCSTINPDSIFGT